MDTLVNNFWARLEGVLQVLAGHLSSRHDGIRIQIGETANNAFPLRAFLTILASDDGDELSVTIDVKKHGDGLVIESDVVGEDGVIVADGPSLEVPGGLRDAAIQERIDDWFNSFDNLVREKSVDIDVAISNLK